jgi:retinol dehydrogenase-13
MKFKIPNVPGWLVAMSGVGTIWGSWVLFKDKRVYYSDEVQIPGKTVIITGANTGLGKHTAMDLAMRKAKVIMACRNMRKCKEARAEIIEKSYNKNVHCKKLDLASFSSIREFARDINREEKHIEVLINNAAVMCPPKANTRDGLELQMGVNYFGHFLLTNLLLDKLKYSAPSRIINLVDLPRPTMHMNFDDLNSDKDYNAQDAYKQSKYALLMFTTSLAEKLEGTGVSSYAIFPGLTSGTELGRHLGMNKSFISRTLLSPFMWLILNQPLIAIKTIVYCAIDDEAENKSGYYWRDMKMKPIAEVNEMSEEDRKRLWAISETWTELTRKSAAASAS